MWERGEGGRGEAGGGGGRGGGIGGETRLWRKHAVYCESLGAGWFAILELGLMMSWDLALSFSKRYTRVYVGCVLGPLGPLG